MYIELFLISLFALCIGVYNIFYRVFSFNTKGLTYVSKCLQNVFIPIGCLLGAIILTIGVSASTQLIAGLLITDRGLTLYVVGGVNIGLFLLATSYLWRLKH